MKVNPANAPFTKAFHAVSLNTPTLRIGGARKRTTHPTSAPALLDNDSFTPRPILSNSFLSLSCLFMSNKNTPEYAFC